MEFTPQNKEAAGLIIMQACNHQFRIEKVLENGKTVLQLIRLTTKQEGLPFLPGYKAETTKAVLESHEVSDAPLTIRVETRRQENRIFYREGDGEEKAFDTIADGAEINPEEVGGMIGTMIGMYATANGEQSENAAAFDFFEMK